MPIRFLSSFEAIDFTDEELEKLALEALSPDDFVTEEKVYGTGKTAKLAIWGKGFPPPLPPVEEGKMLSRKDVYLEFSWNTRGK